MRLKMGTTAMQSVSALALAGALLATPAHGGIIAKDKYVIGPDDYSTGGLGGQAGVSELGFSGTWSVSSANLQADTLSLGFDDGSGKGKFIASTAFSDFERSAERLLTAPVATPTNNTFYMSHDVFAGPLAIGGDDEVDGYAMVGFGSFVNKSVLTGASGNLLGAYVGFVPSATEPGGVDLVIRSRTGLSTVSDQLLVADAENITYQVVMALEYNNPGDKIRYWLNPTDFDNGESGLTATAAASGTIVGFQLSATSDMSRLNIETYGFDHSFFWDNSVLADDVASLPEPASLTLLGLGALALGRRR